MAMCRSLVHLDLGFNMRPWSLQAVRNTHTDSRCSQLGVVNIASSAPLTDMTCCVGWFLLSYTDLYWHRLPPRLPHGMQHHSYLTHARPAPSTTCKQIGVPVTQFEKIRRDSTPVLLPVHIVALSVYCPSSYCNVIVNSSPHGRTEETGLTFEVFFKCGQVLGD